MKDIDEVIKWFSKQRPHVQRSLIALLNAKVVAKEALEEFEDLRRMLLKDIEIEEELRR